MNQQLQIIAHRGAWGRYSQNSTAAAVEAVRVGADWVECDVRVLGDGTAVVHHNAWRAGKLLHNMTLADVRQTKSGAAVPTFAEWVSAVGEGAKLLVEIKEPAAVAAALDVLRTVPEDRVMVQSFSGRVLRQTQKMRPGVDICLLEAVPVRVWRKGEAPGMVALFWPYALLGGVWRAQRAGKRVRVWVVNWRWLVQMLARNRAVEGIITDQPARVKQWVGQLTD